MVENNQNKTGVARAVVRGFLSSSFKRTIVVFLFGWVAGIVIQVALLAFAASVLLGASTGQAIVFGLVATVGMRAFTRRILL